MATTFLNGVLVSSAATNQNVIGSGTADAIVSVGNLASSTLDGSAANDTVAYGGGDASANLYDGGSQDDVLLFNSAGFIETNLDNITVYGGTGSDSIGFGSGNAISLPSLFPLSGDYVNISNSLIRGANNDPTRRPDGNDYIFFGEDTIVTRTLINGNEGSDEIDVEGWLRNSTVQGGKNSDRIFYDDSNSSRINGNNDNDVVIGYDAAVSDSNIFGGQGDDYVGFFDSILTNTLVSGDLGADELDFYGSTDYIVYATNSTILGGQDADIIDVYTDNGDDDHAQIVSSLLDGGVGNDSISIGEDVRISASTLAGGDGGDFIFVDTSDSWGGLWNSVVDGGSGNDEIAIGEIGDSGAGITSVFGGDGDDIIDGDSGSYNVGAYWSGDAGNDVIETGDGKDTILGGTGNDTIDGEEGGDLITGGAGNDIFEYWSNDDSYVTGNSAQLGSNIDTITDFDATVDRFRLTYSVANVRTVSAGFSTDWQTTINTALGSGSYGGAVLDNDDAAILTITSGTNAGTYMLYHDRRDADIWRADSDGIVLLNAPTGTVTTSNFLTFN